MTLSASNFNLILLIYYSGPEYGNFNVSKCYLIHLGKSHCHNQYNITGNISSNDVVKNMGIYIDKELKFHNSIAAKANHVLALIHKSFKCMDTGMFI